VVAVTHVATAPHECEGNLIFSEHGLSPYCAVGDVLINQFDGYGETEVEIDGEQWTVALEYQKGGIAPRLEDDVPSDRLYEYRVNADGRGERKASFLIQPRFEEMRHYETGESISTPFDHIAASEGVNVHFSGSNLEPVRYLKLFPQFVQELSQEAGTYVNPEYFTGRVHEMSNITTYERYVRLRRGMAKKIVGSTGIMHSLFQLLSDQAGSDVTYHASNSGPNTDIIGYNHRVVIDEDDADALLRHHRHGKQIKHYHPQYVNDDEDDPLFHPKFGVLLKKSLNGSAFDWHNRRKLRREIDETLINCPRWSGVPVQAGGTTYVADRHFDAAPAEDTVSFEPDPTPKIEAQQDTLLVSTLREMTDSDVEVLEALVDQGQECHPQEIAEHTGRGMSTVYRAFDRLEGLIENDAASVTFTSHKIREEVAGILERVEDRVEGAVDRVRQLLDIEVRQSSSSAFDKRCRKYGAELKPNAEGKSVIRIDTALSRVKSTSAPRLEDVLEEALIALQEDGRDPHDLRRAQVEWRDGGGWSTGFLNALIG
jgi:transposase